MAASDSQATPRPKFVDSGTYFIRDCSYVKQFMKVLQTDATLNCIVLKSFGHRLADIQLFVNGSPIFMYETTMKYSMEPVENKSSVNEFIQAYTYSLKPNEPVALDPYNTFIEYSLDSIMPSGNVRVDFEIY